MTSVFIGGSIRIRALPSKVQSRIDTIMSKQFTILVGDAKGADAAVQEYLASKSYQDVEVFCINEPRTLAMPWTIRTIATFEKEKLSHIDFALKDEAMARKADYGFMIWDGESSGTINNILNLVSMTKKCLVYMKWADCFSAVSTVFDFERLLDKCDLSHIELIDKKIHLKKRITELREGALLVHDNDGKSYNGQ